VTLHSVDGSDPLTVVVMARLQPKISGGVEQAITGMVAGLGGLTDGDERYIVVTDPAAPQWLDQFVGCNTRVIVAPEPVWKSTARCVLRPTLPAIAKILAHGNHVRSKFAIPTWNVATYDPFVESLKGHVVHFPYQWLHYTTAPSLFSPYDIQHVHYPQFFDANTLRQRENMYPRWCDASTLIEVQSHAAKADLAANLGVPSDKIAVIPRSAPTEFAAKIRPATLAFVEQYYALPQPFILFPAQTWPHKNHLRLFDALAILRDRYGLRLPLVCTGHRNNYYQALKDRLAHLGLTDTVYFLGHIPTDHLRALYHLAESVVFPTLFEGGGFPLLEAFAECRSLACSNLPVLMEQAGDAAAYFDPQSAEEMASVLLQLHVNPTIREQLCKRGTERLAEHSWTAVARQYRAIYRSIGGFPLTAEDRSLIHAAVEAHVPPKGDVLYAGTEE